MMRAVLCCERNVFTGDILLLIKAGLFSMVSSLDRYEIVAEGVDRAVEANLSSSESSLTLTPTLLEALQNSSTSPQLEQEEGLVCARQEVCKAREQEGHPIHSTPGTSRE